MLSDIAFALRQFRRQPGFTAVAVFMLAVGLGAATAVFTVADAALLRPLSGIQDPGRLVTLYRVQKNETFDNMGYPDYLDYRDRNQTLSGLAAHCSAPMSLRAGNGERVLGDLVTGNYFQVLGIQPALGRLLIPADDRPDGAPVAVLGYQLWQTKFGGAREVLGQTVAINGFPFTVAGVAPRTFFGTLTGQRFDVWVPLATVGRTIPRLSQTILQSRNAGWIDIFGRLRPGAIFEGVQAEMKSIAGQLSSEYPLTNANRSVAVARGLGLYPEDRAQAGSLISLLATAVALLLLIVCANVATLFVARGWGRQREIAVRLALGAGRLRILRQLVTEGLLLSLIAGGLGLFLSTWTAALMAGIRPGSFLNQLDIHLDPLILLFTFLASLVAGSALALAPARSLPPDLTTSLKTGTPGAGIRRSFEQRFLVVAQVAVSFVLVSGAALLLDGLHRIVVASPGYETRNLAMGSVDLIIQGYSRDRGEALYRELLDRLPHLPGVVCATLASTVPPTEWPGRVSVFRPGSEPPPELFRAREMELGLRVDINRVAPDYFRTLGIPVLQGRDFTVRDNAGSAPVVIVNQSLAHRMWPHDNPVGQWISIPNTEGPPRPPMEVIGVAADTKSRALITEPVQLLYLPLFQNYEGRITLVARTVSNPGALIPGIQDILRHLDRDLALFNTRTMPEHIARSLWQQRMSAGWVGAFSVMALLLAAIGVYGVTAQSIAQRTREVGIRMAVGASPREAATMVIREGMMLAVGGLVLGAPVALALRTRLRDWIAGITAGNALDFDLAGVLLVTVMLAACWIPARRAARIDPLTALRTE